MEISKAYEPQAVEEKWYQFWLDEKCFVADAKSSKPAYSIVIPPPNVTGMLHMGHVLNNTIQDILSRKARMDGKEVLWLPGTDHAGIATQVMVEKQLKKEEKKSRHDLGREEFLKRVWAWKEKHGDIIINQLKKLGCSCDWTRERFTMDPEYSRCVQKVFVELYKKGLIYRGKRMVNWCPVSQTALSDEEVEMKPQRGALYYFKVEVVGQASSLSQTETEKNKNGDRQDACPTFLTIATTRPETIPGDTAVAVNPKDPRYAHLIGKHIVRPLPAELPREQKLIPIIGDEHVDFEFGTGVLKVTPAHDKADFDIGTRHKLPLIEVINADGTMNDLAGADLRGLDRFKARKVAAELLKEQGALVEEKPYENNVGFSQRADVPIEPRLSEQWFLKYPAVAESKACVEQEGDCSGAVSAPNSAAGTAVTDRRYNKMRFHPQRWAKVYDHWLTNIQDWCISRQLWWGHRIPVWQKKFTKEKPPFPGLVDPKLPAATRKQIAEKIFWTDLPWDKVEVEVDSGEIHCSTLRKIDDETGVEEVATTSESFGKELEAAGFTQDPDVLDTWFSSWLWPFATMGWPEQTETLKKFYPTTDLVTGPDIIFFWVARMIMAGYEFMGELPFQNVYFTGIIRDKQGRKMSKTLGNSPDPLELIAKYGADALRFGTMRSAPLGQDVLFDEKDVELGRNFCNKLWNACRFRQMVGQASSLSPSDSENETGKMPVLQFEVQGEIDPQLLTSDDKWILLKLDAAIREVSIALNEYKFSEATSALYRFFWNEYCDWYVEASKAALGKAESGKRKAEDDARKANTLAVIDFVLSHTLRLFHPFLPFITEELWHGMGYSVDMPDNQGGKTIMNAPWPLPLDDDFKEHYGLIASRSGSAKADENKMDEQIERDMFGRQKLVVEIRNIRSQNGIAANKKLKLVYHAPADINPHEKEVLKLLVGADCIEHKFDYHPAKGEPVAYPGFGGKMYVPLAGLIDVAAEKIRLTKEIEKVQAEIEKVEQKLANPNFTQKVPPAVLDEHKQRLTDWQEKLARAKSALDALGN